MNNTVLSDAKRYELMAIINPDLGEDGIKKRVDKMRKLITENHGEIFHDEMWGLRDLAYSIKKQGKGYYAILDFVIDPSAIKEMDRTLRLEPEVLRHMIITLPGSYIPQDYTIVAEEAAEEKTEKEEKKPRPVKKAEPKKAKEDKAESEDASKKKKKDLEEVDAKLKSIIDNPDLNF